MIVNISPVVIIALTEVFDGTVPSKILFPFPWNSYLKTDGTSLIILFLVKNFEEKEIEFLKEQFGKNFCKMMITTGLQSRETFRHVWTVQLFHMLYVEIKRHG